MSKQLRVRAPVTPKVAEEEDNSESDKNESESEGEESGEDVNAKELKKTQRRKKRIPLTDYHLKKKKILARKAQRDAEKKERAANGEPEPEKEVKVVVKEEEPPKPPALTSYSPLQLMCDHLLRKIMAKDPEEYFAFPVTEEDAPDYHKVIKEPMDFSTIRQKIEDNKYSNVQGMKNDCELLVNNAFTFNDPNTVFHLAASRLSTVINYYFGEQYLRYIFHTLPFSKDVPLEQIGIKALSQIVKFENKARNAIVDDTKASDLLSIAAKRKTKLSKRKPKLAFIDNKDGATSLNIVTDDACDEPEAKIMKIGDLVGPLAEGNPGVLSLGEHRLFAQSAIAYLNYGEFGSFAPQFDSTWASLSKNDSDLLLRAYGDRSNVSHASSIRSFVRNCGDYMIKYVDDLLDTLTHGEHTRVLDQINQVKKEQKEEDIPTLVKSVKTLSNLGIDTSFLDDLEGQLNAPSLTIQDKLDASAQAILDLEHLQRKRLTAAPPISLSRVESIGQQEVLLAEQVQHQLVEQISSHVQPQSLINEHTIHNAVGIDDNMDMELLNEFFVT